MCRRISEPTENREEPDFGLAEFQGPWCIGNMKSKGIRRDPGILGGIPVFDGTRVPVRNLLDCLEGGYTIDEFLEDFPTVKKAQVVAFLEDTTADIELAVPA